MTFEDLETRYRELRARWEAGALTESEFLDAVDQLRLQDAAGVWWQIRADGAWLRWDGEQWVEAGRPPQAAPAPPPPEPEAAPPRRRRRGCRGCLLLALVLFLVVAALAAGGYYGVQSGRLSAMGLQAQLQGEGEITITNSADAALDVELESLGEGGGYGRQELAPLDIGGYGGLPPGRYRLTLESEGGAPPDLTCTLRLDRGDRYDLVAVPRGIVITREGQTPPSADEFDAATSSLCNQ